MINDKKGQMGFGFIMGVIMLVVAVLLITSFWPVIQDQFDGLRNQDELNCESTVDICDGSTGSQTICYNATVGNTHGTTCAMLGIGPPVILIFLILGAIGLIIGGGLASRPQPQYPSY